MKNHYRWVVIFLLFLISMTNYIDRASISYAITQIAEEFHLNNQYSGYILGAFGIGYLCTVLIGGMMADKYGSHKVLTFACALWMFATLCLGFAQGFVMFLLARGFLGLAEAPNFPCVTKTVKDWLPLHERNFALSLSLIAVPLSLSFSGPIVTNLIAYFNWRGMYFILAGMSLIFIPLWWFFFRDNPSDSKYVSVEELKLIQGSTQKSKKTHPRIKLAEIIKNKTLMANNWGFFVFGFYLFFFMNWMPSYIDNKFHYKLSEIGLLTVIPWLTATLAMILVGWFTDYIFKKSQSLGSSRTYPLILSHLISGLSLIPLLLCHQIEWIILFLSLSIAAVMSVNAVYYSVNIDIAGSLAATAYGIMGLLFSLSGILSPILTGWIVNLTGSFNSAFVIMVCLSFSSILILWLFHNKDES